MKNARRYLLAGLALSFLAIAAATAWLYQDYQRFRDAPMNRGGEPMVITLPGGTSYQGMVERLQSMGLADQPLYWRLLGWRHDAGRRIQAGEYAIEPGMTPGGFLEAVMSGRVIQYAFTIVEGWTFRDLTANLARHEALAHTLEGLDHESIMTRLDHPGQHPEGRFLPETYHFPRGTTDVELLGRAHRAMQQALESAWDGRDRELPYESPSEVLIMASIIEKETAVPAERRQIAGVFVRRLRRGMRLQTDPTVIYGMGENYAGNIRRRDLRTDTPYNTYTRGGLPPTPIAMPGRDSLRAAVHPAPGTALYFVSRGDGTHVFSDTLEEHNRAVARFQMKGSGGNEGNDSNE